MKIAVIIGVLQMSLGIVMKGFNAIHFGKPLDFIFEFIPQIVMLNVLFGWMDALIIAKWLYPYQLQWTSQAQYNDVARAPSIITVMINMFLQAGLNPDPKPAPPDFVVYAINIFPNQTTLSVAFVLIIFICVPLMLCVKPCVFLCTHKKHDDHVEEEH